MRTVENLLMIMRLRDLNMLFPHDVDKHLRYWVRQVLRRVVLFASDPRGW